MLRRVRLGWLNSSCGPLTDRSGVPSCLRSQEEVELEGDDDAGVDLTAETRTAKRRKIGD